MLSGVIHKLMAKQPEQRYDSAAVLRDDLRNAVGVSVHAQPTQVVTSAPRPLPEPPVVHQPLPARPAPPLPVQPAVATPTHKKIGLRFMAIPLILGVLLLAGLAFGNRNQNDSPNLSAPSAPAGSVSVPAPIVVPNVIGQPVTAAKQQLQVAGFNNVVDVAVVSDQPAGQVLSTQPAPDQPLEPGTAIVLQVSAGPQQVAPPAAEVAPPPPEVAPPPPTDDDNNKDDDKDEKKEEEKKAEEKKDEDKGKGKGKKDD
jgi:serine/threonine-protein kinase